MSEKLGKNWVPVNRLLSKMKTFLFCVVFALSVSISAADKPNILFILADDLGYGDVGCYNAQSKVPTPHLDRLAKEGIRFTDAHSPSTVCTPTRYSVLTGRMAFRLNYRGVFTGVGGPCLINPGRMTLASLLKQQGYATAMFGKWHVGLTAFDKEGKPIHQNGLAAVQRMDYARPIKGGPLDHGFERFFGTASCPTTDWLYAYIDGDRVQQVIFNLVDNAIKYGRHGGTVRVETPEYEAGQEMVEVAITDDGPGIPAESLDKIFERFFRVDKARSRDAGGTGLGLSIVKHIIQSHGGRVRVESQVDRGTTFFFTLPTRPKTKATSAVTGQ